MNEQEGPSQKPQSAWGQVQDFVNNMDARAWRAVGVTFALFVIVGAMLVVGRLYFGNQLQDWVRGWLGGAGREHWGLPAAIAAFTLAAFVGIPQYALVGLCVLAFGAEAAFWYSWIATVVSGAVTFLVGKLFGERMLKRYSGATGGRFTAFMRRRGFLTSFAVRFVPTAPFIVVNMAMATAGVGFVKFIAGLTLGSLPKTAMVAFAGDALVDAIEGRLKAGTGLLLAIGAIVFWFAVVWIVRRFVRKQEHAGDTN